MAFRISSHAVLGVSLLALCAPAFLPLPDSSDQELSQEKHQERNSVPKSKEKCFGTGTAVINLETIEASHEDIMLADISSRSLTPWDYSKDRDANRYPEVIEHADCRHSMCLTPEGKEDFRLNSIPVGHHILVLRRVQKDCNQVYKLEKQWVTFGCTCVRPIVSYFSY